eukprot:5305786-Pleurochrysis_carterae.AAC.2
MIKRHPREPLRFVIKLRSHVKVDGDVRELVQHLAQPHALLPPALPSRGRASSACCAESTAAPPMQTQASRRQTSARPTATRPLRQ